MDYLCDVIVIGAGSGGLVVAKGAAALGKTVILVERENIGGECTHFGCIPSKVLVNSTRVLKRIKDADRYGLNKHRPTYSFAKLKRHLKSIVKSFDQEHSPEELEKAGVVTVFGEASFIDNHTIQVNNKKLTAKTFVVCTGATPRVPDIPGIEYVKYHTNKTIFNISKVPKKLAIIGAGPVGCEMAQIFSRLGSKVFLVDRGSKLLPREDPDVSELMIESMKAEGISFHFNSTFGRVARQDKGVWIQLTNSHFLTVDALLIATGRVANVPKGLVEIGANLSSDGHIWVDRHMRTRVSNIYACGDCANSTNFTHVAEQQARAIVTNAFIPFAKKTAERDVIPRVTFTDPEIASVGLNQERIMRKGIKHRLYKSFFTSNDLARAENETIGFVKIFTKPFSGKILGASIIGKNAGELINEISLAMKEDISIKKLSELVHPYPTRSVLVKNVADKYFKEYLPDLFGKLRGPFR